MYDHMLNALKGWPTAWAVDKVANLADDSAAVLAGSVMSLNSDGEFVLGLIENAMAVFALQNSTDFDVVGDEGNIVGKGSSIPRISGLVAAGAYELETTEFVSSEGLVPNAALTSPAPGVSNAGKLAVGTVYTDTICGVVSDGVVNNCYGVEMLRFWPAWLPVTPS
jgi:hypothetical protein